MGPDFSDQFVSVQQPVTEQVDLRGFEPLTFSVRLRRAPNCATGPFMIIPQTRGKAKDILLEALRDVKQGILSIYDFLTGNGPLADNT